MLRSPVGAKHQALHAQHTDPLFQESLQDYHFVYESEPTILFTENETNTERIFGTPNASPYVKDAFHRYLVDGQAGAKETGTGKGNRW